MRMCTWRSARSALATLRSKSGDALTFAGPENLTFTASEESQILFFDLA